jgi:hypothetical protein
MACHRNRVAPQEPREGSESRTRRHVISLRITDQEKELLDTMSFSSAQNISELLREAMICWLSQQTSTSRNTH